MSGTLRDILEECKRYGNMDPVYYRHMAQHVPDAPSIDRAEYLIHMATDKRVLSLGASGPMQAEIDRVAMKSYGTDISIPSSKEMAAKAGFCRMDLDSEDISDLPDWDVDLIICGEVIEHLINPGRVLRMLSKYGVPVIITVPNAFCPQWSSQLKNSVEWVNGDHVAWYSYTTMKGLLRRAGYNILDWYWYNGPPLTAEGLIFVAEWRMQRGKEDGKENRKEG